MGEIGIAIRTEGLTKVYRIGIRGTHKGIGDLTMEVPEGLIYGLVGPNGAGKTTTLKLLLGLLFPTAGTGEVLGHPLGSSEYKARIGYVPDGPYFYDHLNAPELLRFYGTLFGLRGPALEQRIAELLELVGMADRAHFRVHEYSKGMRQRVAVAQALLNDPDLIFLDEPTAGLDPMGAIQMRNIVLDLRARGKTVFLCSHLLKDMEPMCDRVAIVSRGQLKLEGPIDEVLQAGAGYRVRTTGLSAETRAKVESAATEIVGPDEEGVVVVKAADQRQALEIAGLAAGDGSEILEVGPDRRTLEEVFIDVVEGQAGD
ncbi:MAG: ABC transporter ATP-binding protein [Armatimonadetes bacterium]|nr:ABC transporter ATP-binding protein [Armatimonadota bacterium]